MDGEKNEKQKMWSNRIKRMKIIKKPWYIEYDMWKNASIKSDENNVSNSDDDGCLVDVY